MVYLSIEMNDNEETLRYAISNEFDSLNLLDFPIDNLDNVDLSSDSFLANDIFPDNIIQNDENNTVENYCDEFEGHENNMKRHIVYRDFSKIQDNQALM